MVRRLEERAGATWRVAKRSLDIVLSAAALCLLSPVLLFLASGVKAGSPGPAIYRQTRCGRGGQHFFIYKFRTMKVDAEDGTPRLAVPGDPRVTSFGRILRQYHLDELPQLWNVLRGDMSLVGPRPERPYFVALIRRRNPDYDRLFAVRPGLTSLGMVRFGYASDLDGMVERSRFDMAYLSRQSALTDLRILAETACVVVKGKGV